MTVRIRRKKKILFIIICYIIFQSHRFSFGVDAVYRLVEKKKHREIAKYPMAILLNFIKGTGFVKGAR